MSDTPLKKLYAREWLNKDKGRAYIIIDAESNHGTRDGWVDASIEIGDCNRSISLEFYYDKEEDRVERLRKIDSLLAHIQSVREFIAETPVPKKKEKEE